MSVEEMVASFLHILAHHTKNRQHDLGCLGALDGTHIKVNVPIVDKPRYRSRKGDIVTNVLGVCTSSMQFIYVLPGWERSAANGQVLRDAISRRCYYLCDVGYTNGEGFLAPYRGQRYHLNEWRHGHQPRTLVEMETDPIKDVVVQDDSTQESEDDGDKAFIPHCETSDAWMEFRNKFANDMFNSWRAVFICRQQQKWNFAYMHNRFLWKQISQVLRNPFCRTQWKEISPKKKQGNLRVIRGTQHTWTPNKDVVLIRCLQTLSEDLKWKGDNGTFRAGYLVQLEKMIELELPNACIKAEPHIDSRIRLLRRHYHAIVEMITIGNGFGWNDSEKCVTALKDVFDDWVRSHPYAKGLRNKPFPFFEELDEIFGLDRATGEGAETAADAVKAEKEKDDENHYFDPFGLKEDAEVGENVTTQVGGGNVGSNTDEEVAEVDISTCNMPAGKKNASTSRKKAKSSLGTNDVVDHLVNFQAAYQETTNEMKSISSYVKKEVEKNERKMALFDEWKTVQGFSREELISVGQELMKDTYKMDAFFFMPTDFRSEYLKMLLNEINHYRPSFQHFDNADSM
ncbi:hypothetical protein PTKIN_Ptkin12aG0139000 [Pterospermum kingtungense]